MMEEQETVMSSNLGNTTQTDELNSNVNQSSSQSGVSSSESSDTQASSSESQSDPSAYESSSSEQCVPQNISVDFTEVSELEDFQCLSNIEDSAPLRRNENKIIEENGEALTGLPKLDFSGDWYNHKCFRSYWEHYSYAMNWCKKHYETMDKMQTQQKQKHHHHQQQHHHYNHHHHHHQQQQQNWMSYFYQSQYPYTSQTAHMNDYPMPPYGNFSTHPYIPVTKSDSSVGAMKTKKRRRGGRKQNKRKQKELSSSSSDSPRKTESEFEMEVTQDMIDFFVKSHEHRKLRDEEKKTNTENGQQEEHINVEQVGTAKEKVPTIEAPKERPGSRRTAEMKLLYGKGAAMIHGMETALQMAFDRNTDICQPKYWPNMPLKVVFG